MFLCSHISNIMIISKKTQQEHLCNVLIFKRLKNSTPKENNSVDDDDDDDEGGGNGAGDGNGGVGNVGNPKICSGDSSNVDDDAEGCSNIIQ